VGLQRTDLIRGPSRLLVRAAVDEDVDPWIKSEEGDWYGALVRWPLID
jgi:hypothetical protein